MPCRAIADGIKNKIINQPADLISVVLYNTVRFCLSRFFHRWSRPIAPQAKDKNDNNFKNVYVLRPLDQPDAKLIKDVQALKEQKEFDSRIGMRYARSGLLTIRSCPGDVGSVASEKGDFSSALWICNTLFGDAYAALA